MTWARSSRSRPSSRSNAPRRCARTGDGPLYGVPTAIKDLNLTAGMPTAFGSPVFADFVPDVSDAVTLAIEAAGMVSLGKTRRRSSARPATPSPRATRPR